MKKGRRIRKEDIGDPSNFVHVNHVGFGPKKSSITSITTQKSFDLDPDHDCSSTTEESSSANTRISVENDDEISGPHYPVERRNKGHRSSLIPRHHRSTTTCIFPPENNPYSISRGNKSSQRNHHERSETPSTPGPETKSMLKPTFGSLLNLSFLPLGMGKSSSKSPSVGKTKRMSLLNLTASNLFANPKEKYEENRESVHMTGYIKRRSFSNSNDGIDDGETASAKPVQVHQNEMEDSGGKPQVNAQAASKANGSTRIPLAKLGRSKSSMSEFTKRPKLRLKIPPPVPPPKPPRDTIKNRIEAETLPSPPPSPIPSPPPSPVPASPPFMEVALRKSPKTAPRPRIIPLPSASSHDSLDHDLEPSPQFLTPAGGNSPLSTNEASFPLLLSPTIPPSSTPFFPTSSSTPGTPPVWPLQPTWPTSLPVQKEATIPEVPSPSQEKMETSENDYDPVLSIVESFITCGEESLTEDTGSQRMDSDSVGLRLAITTSNINSISSVLRENIEYIHWPQLAHKLFQSIPKVPSNDNVPCLSSCSTNSGNDTYGCLLTKTLELWLEKAGDEAVVEKLVTVLNEENHHQATESLRKVFGDLHV